MSDASGKGPTAPMNARATQMSASTVPSTLESPKDPPKLDTTERMEDVPTKKGEELPVVEIIGGPMALEPPRDDKARQLALLKHTLELEDGTAQRSGPRTLMSPAVPALGAAKDGARASDPSPEEAVTFASPLPIAQGHVFGAVHGSVGPSAHGGSHGHHSAHAHSSGVGPAGLPAPRRSMSTTTIALIIAGALAAVFVIGSIATGIYIFRARQAEAELERARRAVPLGPGPSSGSLPLTPPTTPPTPPAPPGRRGR